MSQALKLLIVEDSENDVFLLLHTLRRGGYSVTSTVVDSPGAMRAALKNGDWDVVTSDHVMPCFNAPEALALAKELRPDVPFIIVSGEMDLALAVSLMRDGAKDFIQKQNLALLVPAIERVLHEAELRCERQRNEAALREKERWHQTILQTAMDGFWMVDWEGSLLEVNEAYSRMSGYSVEELLGMHLTDLEFGEAANDTAGHMQKVIAQGQDQFETRHRRKDGSVFDLEISVQYRPDQGGRLAVFLRDITERKRADAEREALLEIMQGLAVTRDLQDILALVHRSVAKVIYARNLFVVFYNKATGFFEEVYSVDQYDPPAPPSRLEKSITAYVYHSGKPLIVTQGLFDRLEAQGEVEMVGTNSPSWMGAPLLSPDGAIGVIAVQDYETPDRYSERDLSFLAHIGSQVALAIGRKRAEEERLANAELLDLFMRHSPIYCYIKDVNPTRSLVLHASENFKEMVGIPGHEMIGRSMEELFPPGFAAKMTADDWAVASKGEVLKLDEELNGRSYATIKFPIQQGDRTLLAGYTIDTTERDQAEAALRESAARDKILFQNNHVIMLVIDPINSMIVDANPAACAYYGWSRDELLQKKIGEINTLTEDEIFFAMELSRTNQRSYFEFKHRRADGSIRDVEVYSGPLVQGGKNLLYSIIHDITERKQAEEGLRESQALTTAIIDSTVDLIWSVDPEHFRLILFNSGLREYFLRGRGIAIRIGMGLEDLFPTDEFVQRWRGLYQRALMEGPYKTEYATFNTGRQLQLTFNLMKRDGQVFGISVFGKDITENKQAEEHILRLNAELEQRVADRTAQLSAANLELEAFSYSVSHDLRAPLRSLNGFSAILLEDFGSQLDAQGRQYLTRIRDSARRMDQLVNDLLTLSRLTRVDLKRKKVNLSVLAERVCADLIAQMPQRQVKTDITAGLIAEGDENLLKIVLENLLGNALKFTGQREAAVIQVGVEEQEGKPVFFVRDNGAGFNKDYIGRLFTPFQRLHSDQEFPGTGIGLATVQRIIQRHGGRVWAQGEVDQGATIYFTLA
jgi:PAS domain S-box-containing protein